MQSTENLLSEIIFDLRLQERGMGSKGRDPISAEELCETVFRAAGQTVNCYPGFPTIDCYQEAFFFSFVNERYRSSSTYRSFEWALQQMVEHLKNRCPKTEKAILLTDSWHPTKLSRYAQELHELERRAFLADKSLIEIHFFDGRSLHSIDFP